MFANNGWIERNPIPPAFASWGTFNELSERNTLVLKGIAERAATQATTTPDSSTRKLGTFYASCMDSTTAERAGIEPIADELARIEAIDDRAAATGRDRAAAHARLWRRVRLRRGRRREERRARHRQRLAGRAHPARPRVLSARRHRRNGHARSARRERHVDALARGRSDAGGGVESAAHPRARDLHSRGRSSRASRCATRTRATIP